MQDAVAILNYLYAQKLSCASGGHEHCSIIFPFVNQTLPSPWALVNFLNLLNAFEHFS